MKVKKIITAGLAAALVVSAALPLTACGGVKPLEKTEGISLRNYATQLDFEELNKYAPNPATVRSIQNNSGGLDIYEKGKFVLTHYQSSTVDTISHYVSVAEKKTGRTMVYGAETQSSQVLIINNRFVLVANRTELYDEEGEPDGYEMSFSLYSEDGSALLSGVDNIDIGQNYPDNYGYYYALNDSDLFTSVEGYLPYDEELRGFTKVTYTKKDEEKTVFFMYSENEDGSREYANNEYKAEDIIGYSSEFAAGNSVFSAGKALNDLYEERSTNISDNYRVKNIGSEMVFYDGDTEMSRISMDNVDNYVIVGDVMLYTKLVALPEGDKKANLIVPLRNGDGYYSYELHSFQYPINKDKKLPNYGIKIDEMAPMFNYNSNSYDAIAISGAKLDGKKYQDSAPFQYIITKDFELGLDATGLPSFTYEKSDSRAKIVQLNNGELAVNYNGALTLVSDKLEPISEMPRYYYSYWEGMQFYSVNETLYYGRNNIFGFYNNDTGTFGFTDKDGKIVIEPIYQPVSGDVIKFYNGQALVENVRTRKTVLLSDAGVETPITEYYEDDEKSVRTQAFEGGFYYTLTHYFDVEGTDHSPYEFVLYGFNGNELYSNDSEDEISFVNYTGNLYELRVNSYQTIALIYVGPNYN